MRCCNRKTVRYWLLITILLMASELCFSTQESNTQQDASAQHQQGQAQTPSNATDPITAAANR
jgi:uncharacterized protein YdeI (BOF family)